MKVRPSRFFTQNAKQLQKKFPHVLNDVSPLKDRLENGETPGERLQNLNPHIVYKVRIKNTDARKGKSGGYRVIYFLKTVDAILLISIYTKSAQENISADFIRQIIAEESEDNS